MPEGVRQLSAAAEAMLGRPLTLSDLIVAAFPVAALASFAPEAKEYVRRLLGHSRPTLVINFYEEFDPHPPSGKPWFPPYRRSIVLGLADLEANGVKLDGSIFLEQRFFSVRNDGATTAEQVRAELIRVLYGSHARPIRWPLPSIVAGAGPLEILPGGEAMFFLLEFYSRVVHMLTHEAHAIDKEQLDSLHFETTPNIYAGRPLGLSVPRMEGGYPVGLPTTAAKVSIDIAILAHNSRPTYA
jgi:hypothetical protein